MADAPQQVNSPDGRSWTVSIEGRKRSLKETRETPFFWAHIIVTAIIAAVMIYIFRNNNGVLWILVVATVIIWAVGALGALFGAMVKAETEGPPKEHRLWKVTKRSARNQAARDVAAAISRGELTAEPPHTRLEEI
jgi:hypothetical protein